MAIAGYRDSPVRAVLDPLPAVLEALAREAREAAEAGTTHAADVAW
jgi:hypothetical protein